MSAASDHTFSVQKFRGGFALVWWENGKRRRRQLASTDRQSAEAEARKLWSGAEDRSSWTVGRVMNVYLASIAEKPSHRRRQDAWRAMGGFWENVDPAMIDETMCQRYRSTRQVSDTTARYELQQLSTALRFGFDKFDGMPKLWFPPLPEHKIRHLTRSEFERFLGA